mmetsp:Transcript_6608/g.7203  ORF Transcript_6608/g.7203 Transcript_6608/m.7203 type:complete len:553 (+) Transcript_6608:120-1778(+)
MSNPQAEESLWLKLLKESTNRSSSSDALIILLGDLATNKRSLISYLCGVGQKTQTHSFLNTPITSDESLLQLLENVTYDYFDIDEAVFEASSSTSTSSSSSIRVNIWTVDHRMFPSLSNLLHIKASIVDQRVLFLIALDLSQGEENLLILKKSIKQISSFIPDYFHILDNEDRKKSFKDTWYHYVSNARINKGSKIQYPSYNTSNENSNTNESKVENHSHDDIDITEIKSSLYYHGYENFPFPIIVVGFNHQTISNILQSNQSLAGGTANAVSTSNINDLLQVNKFKELIGKIRYYCLDLGFSLLLIPSFTDTITPSSAPPSTSNVSNNNKNNNSNSNTISLLKKYIIHRMYPEQVALDLTVEEKLDRVFIPSGFDTSDLIQISSGVKYQEKDYSYPLWIKGVTETNQANSSSLAASTTGLIEVENEQDWLQGLYSFMSQGAGDSGKFSTNLSDLLAEESTATHGEVHEKPKKLSSNLSNNNLVAAATSNSATANSSKNVSPSNKVENVLSTTSVPAAKTIPRRASTRTASAASATNTQDFFKSLLEGNPKK